MYEEHENKNILSIPLSTRLPQDSIIWSKNPSGVFSTQSAYQLVASDALASSPCSSNSHPQRLLWRGAWTLRTSNKVKHFIRRAYNNSLPTMDNIFCRQIVVSDRYNIYKTHPEDILHVVWGCSEVANLWKALIWAQHVVSPPLGDFTNLFSNFLQVRDNYGVEFFCNHILIALEQTKCDSPWPLNWPTEPSVICSWWDVARLPRCPRWSLNDTLSFNLASLECPPIQTRYKANFDGALFSSIDAAGLGVVICDNVVAVIGALSMRIPLPQSMATMETLACKRAVQFAIEIGLHEVIFGGDAAVVIQAIKNKEADQSAHGHIVGDIQDQVSLLAFFYLFLFCSPFM